MRALAEAAALTSTSLRERWSEPGDEAKAGFLVEGTALAVGREETQEFSDYMARRGISSSVCRCFRQKVFYFPVATATPLVHEFLFTVCNVKLVVCSHLLLPTLFFTDRGRLWGEKKDGFVFISSAASVCVVWLIEITDLDSPHADKDPDSAVNGD